MLFNVSGLLREPVGATRRYVLDPEPPVHRGAVELIRTPHAILVRCDADVLIEADCSRCLAAFAYRAPVSFEELYAQQVDVVSGERLAIEDEDGFRIATDHTIDITEALRQYTEMAAAMQPLCRPDCPGMCPECGTDLSLGACSCDRTPRDPRWAALATLKRPNG